MAADRSQAVPSRASVPPSSPCRSAARARMRQMVWIALGLLGLVLASLIGGRVIAARVAANHEPQLLGPEATRARYGDPWSLNARRFPRRSGKTYGDISVAMNVLGEAIPLRPEAAAFLRLSAAAFESVLQSSLVYHVRPLGSLLSSSSVSCCRCGAWTSRRKRWAASARPGRSSGC